MGAEAFVVIREAINKNGMVAIGKVVFTSREHIIALEARGKGVLGVTLRYPYEGKPSARSVQHRGTAKKKASRSSARQRKTG